MEQFTKTLIKDHINFLKQQLKNCKVELRPLEGLNKLLNESEDYLNAPTDKNNHAILALYCLVNSLRILDQKGITFCQQLKSMNSGDFEYGKVSKVQEHFYKDFEFEIFCAAHITSKGLKVMLPQDTIGNDIYYKNDIQIQCKHPDRSHIKKVWGYLRDFSKTLRGEDKFGIFILGMDTYFDGSEPSEESLKELDVLMQEGFCKWEKETRILGVCSTNTYYSFIGNGIKIDRTGNGCIRKKSNQKISQKIYEDALQIVKCFNPKPTIMKF